MPKRVLDFDAMWGSDKVASCAAWAQAEYAWLYGLADASGCFEITNLRVIWGRVAAIRGNFTIERLEQVFAEFQDKGLLFVWDHEGKRYAHWTGSDVPGRLPPPSWRMRLEKFAPPVPKKELAEYMSRFARGRAALAGVGFRGESARGNGNQDLKFDSSELREKQGSGARDEYLRFGGMRAGVPEGGRETNRGRNDHFEGNSGIKDGVEEAQAQDLNLGLDWNLKEKWELGRDGERRGAGDANQQADCGETRICNSNSQTNAQASSNVMPKSNANSSAKALNSEKLNSNANSNAQPNSNSVSDSRELAAVNLQAMANDQEASGESASPGARSQRNANQECGTGERADFNACSQAPGDGDARSRSWQDNFPSLGRYARSEKELALARELRVGQGPVCGPIGVRREAIERDRQRQAARAKAGTRAP